MELQQPKVALFAEEYDALGNPVFGHLIRIQSIKEEFNRRGIPCGKCVCPSISQSDILIVDSWKQYKRAYDGINVSITDTRRSSLIPCNIIINQNFSSEEVIYNNISQQLLGDDFFIASEELLDTVPYRKRYAVLIPGGNAVEFGNQINQERLERVLFAWGYRLKVAQNLDHSEFLRMVGSASLVISSASCSALEAVALRKPLFIIQTAKDQEINYRGMIARNIAKPYNIDDIGSVISKNFDKDAYIIAVDGKIRIVDTILKEWQKWQKRK